MRRKDDETMVMWGKQNDIKKKVADHMKKSILNKNLGKLEGV
jgi:hypothetical protein